MRIVLYQGRSVVNSVGGAEKVFCELSNGLVAIGHKVRSITSENKAGLPFYPLSAGVEFLNIRTYLGFVGRIFYLKREFDKFNPDVIVFFFLADFLRASFVLGSRRCVLMLHCEPDYYKNKLPFYKRAFFGLVKSKLSAVQVLLPEYVDSASFFSNRVKVIANGVDLSYYTQSSLKNKKILCLARFDSAQKRQHILIQSFAMIASRFPDWSLDFWGSEADKNYSIYCRSLVHSFGLQNRVFFHGTTAATNLVYSDAGIFALPSAYEGFPLVVLEAMAAGLPVVAFKECVAASSVINDGINGILCDSGFIGLADKLCILMADENFRVSVGNRARESVLKYDQVHINNQWSSFLDDLVKGHE